VTDELNGLNDEEREILAELEGEPIPVPQASPPKDNLYEVFHKLVGNDLCVIFGDTGAGKTRTCFQVASDAISLGKKVMYIDTEGNLSDNMKKTLERIGAHYIRVMNHDQVSQHADRASGFDVIIIDSATLYITGLWSRLEHNKQMNLVQKLQGLYYMIKQKCAKDGVMALMVAQPRSTYGDEKKVISPLGDKAQFMSKVIIRITCERASDGRPIKRALILFRSRDIEDGTLVSHFTTTRVGVKLLEWDRVRTMLR
jgi:hypothetical protein